MARLWLQCLVLGVCLLQCTFAGRQSDISRRHGYHPQAIRDAETAARGLEERASHKRRYYNGGTKSTLQTRMSPLSFAQAADEIAEYFVESLPDIPQSFLTEMYSGLIPLDESDPGRALFFVFQPRVGPPVNEITIWLNGGPGCSSLEGFLQENGLIQWTWGQYAPQIQPYSWPNLTNVLWVEQPVGTGFSTGTPNATSEEDIASDFLKFFRNFEVGGLRLVCKLRY
jgi:carboxypeptidase D